METKDCYKEILKLKDLLSCNDIPFKFKKMFDGYQIIIFDKDKKALCDVIEHFGSYGQEDDLLEIMGGLTEEEQDDNSVLGYLKAEEVFERFKYCYENSTSTYVKVN